MKVIIPMTGYGRRFVEACYDQPKPLITVNGKPIIEHVLNLMPGEDDIIFVCNEDHRYTTRLERVLQELKPQGQILWRKKDRGPVVAVLEAAEYIDDQSPYMVSYCDFGGWWDYHAFKKNITESKCSAALPAYIGFHPHLLNRSLYASMKVSKDMRLEQIKEKYCFTADPMGCYQQPGSFYFSSGGLMKKYMQRFIKEGEPINGEYYISMVYDLMQKDGLDISVFEMPFFCQWGTPEDLEEFEAWARITYPLNGLLKKPYTAIPLGREKYVHIKYPVGAQKYDESYTYWRNYYKQILY